MPREMRIPRRIVEETDIETECRLVKGGSGQEFGCKVVISQGMVGEVSKRRALHRRERM